MRGKKVAVHTLLCNGRVSFLNVILILVIAISLQDILFAVVPLFLGLLVAAKKQKPTSTKFLRIVAVLVFFLAGVAIVLEHRDRQRVCCRCWVAGCVPCLVLPFLFLLQHIASTTCALQLAR